MITDRVVSVEFSRKDTMNFYNSVIRQDLIEQGLDKKAAQAHKELFKGNADLYQSFVERFSMFIWSHCVAINKSKYKKAKRVRERTRDFILTGSAIFLTLTFNDATLSRTSEKTRRRYVSRFLKANCSEYVANIDFGDKDRVYKDKKGKTRITTEREHYHALVYISDGVLIDFEQWHNYGSVYMEYIKADERDIRKVARYTAKLSNHALKVKGDVPRLIYSRKKSG